MSPRMIALEVIAVLAGAIIGMLVTDFLQWLFADGDFFALIGSLGRFVVAVITVAIFAFYYSRMPATPAALASFFTGVGLPAIIIKFGFDDTLTWGMALFLFTVFSLVALSVYRFVHTNAAVREAVSDEAGRL